MNSEAQQEPIKSEGKWVLELYCYLPEELFDTQRVNAILTFLRKNFTYQIFPLEGEEYIPPEQTRAVYVWKFRPKKQEEVKTD